MLYVGRIVCVGITPSGRVFAGYRVSSRSFPNRRAIERENAVSIIPKQGHEGDVEKNPYIAYNCARIVRSGQVAVLTNGSQTDPVAEKIDGGMPIRDALALSLLALDYEHDSFNTPRICSVVDRGSSACWLATVRKDALVVKQLHLKPGRFAYVATYEEDDVVNEQTGAFTCEAPESVCEFLLNGGVFAERAHPISAVAAVATDTGFALALRDAQAA
ncbi:MAG: IMP cyclohydrolase [Candidatus Hydrogenedentes bacterium]|nr:IMP cyclohydrolase [Candidatus Hydrogenedentota bacterium]